MGRVSMVNQADALKGRDKKIKVSEHHYVLGGKLEGPFPSHLKVCVLANGCFWGSEKGMWRLPGGGIYSTAVGYVGGYTPNPTYEEVCSGMTGHTEAVQVVFDPEKISFVDILRWFWQSHDPTQGMGQGNDVGTQYRSGAYFVDEEQRKLMEASKAAYEKVLRKKITTEVAPLSTFYYAEDYHQQYLAKPGARPYCSAQPLCVSLPPFKEWASAELAAHSPKLPEAFWDKHAPTPHCVIRQPNAPIAVETYADPATPATENIKGVEPADQVTRRQSLLGRARRAIFGGSGSPAAAPEATIPTGESSTKDEHLHVSVGGETVFGFQEGHNKPTRGDEAIMRQKAHGTSATPVQQVLRWECDVRTADRICNFNRHYAEHAGYFMETKFVRDLHRAEREGEPLTFYDSNSGAPLFRAPTNRSHDKFMKESKAHGWPSFRDAEVNWDKVRILPNGECVSIDGTHLGHNLPDSSGNRYCINLVSVAGHPKED